MRSARLLRATVGLCAATMAGPGSVQGRVDQLMADSADEMRRQGKLELSDCYHSASVSEQQQPRAASSIYYVAFFGILSGNACCF